MIRQKGFSLLHVLGALAIMAAVVASQIPSQKLKMQEQGYDYAAEKVREHLRAASRMRLNTGSWPGSPAALISAGYLPAGSQTSPWQTPFIYSTTGSDFNVRVDTTNNADAQSVSGRLPRALVSGTNLTASIDPPGLEASHDALYARDGSRPLTGAMNANNQQINNASRVEANQFVDNNNNAFYADPASRSQFSTMDVSSIRDRDNTAFTWNGSGTSTMNNISLDGNLTDRDNGTYRLNPDFYNRMYRVEIDRMQGVWRDHNNTAYQLDLSGTSKSNILEVNDLRLMANQTEGSGCSDPNRIAKDASGDFLTCTNSGGGGYRWRYTDKPTACNWTGQRINSINIRSGQLRDNSYCWAITCTDGRVSRIELRNNLGVKYCGN